MVNRVIRKVSRLINQLHRYDYFPENNDWKKIGLRPVWGNMAMGTMFDPYVIYDSDVFKMVVSSRKASSIYLVCSKDGELWNDPICLLEPRPDHWDCVVNRGCLVIVGGKWHLWYTGQRLGISSIGLAISDDGIHFNRVSSEPILTAESKIEGVSVMNPCVLWDEDASIFKMWYSAGENYEPDVICYAESEDGIHWNKFDKPVLEKYSEHRWEQAKVGGCQVLKEKDGSYTIYYIGYQNVDVARICIAHSKDGIHWKRDKNNLLLGPTKGSWDADATYKPTVVRMGGKTYMWYNGRTKNREYIGLAIK